MSDTPSAPLPEAGPARRAWHRVARRYPNGARRFRRGIGTVTEYARLPFARWRKPNPLFEGDWYLATYPDVKASGAEPYRHFRFHGVWEGKDPNEFFDTRWYLRTYPDVRASGRNPLDHYLVSGWVEGRDPGPRFSTRWYLDEHPDLKKSGTNPLLDHLRSGRAKGRETLPPGRRKNQSRRASAESASDARDPPLEAAISRLLPEALGNSTSAIANFESLRADGVACLSMPPNLQRLPAFARHVTRYEALGPDPDGWMMVDVRAPRVDPAGSLEHELTRLFEVAGLRSDRPPSILAWQVDPDLTQLVPGGQPFAPPAWVDGRLPYLDHSIDIVLLGAADPTTIREATRVASLAVLAVHGVSVERSVQVAWQTTEPAAAMPSVSVVIPTFNGSGLVAACLRTLWETLPAGAPVEVIVVDDASDAASNGTLKQTCRDARVTLLRNDENIGFLGSVTRGALAATGEYLLFLNDDTLLLPGWLPPLLRTFRHRDDAGAVGGRLIYPDGRLMEAGGIIYRNGSGANYGNGDPNPEAPHYGYLREVDYVSGAMLATPRQLFIDLGGFDPIYGFGYYEDTDYCFRLREAGRRVYYQPQSVIVHREGVSAGTDLAAGAKQFQVRNRPIFVERWQAQLAAQASPP